MNEHIENPGAYIEEQLRLFLQKHKDISDIFLTDVLLTETILQHQHHFHGFCANTGGGALTALFYEYDTKPVFIDLLESPLKDPWQEWLRVAGYLFADIARPIGGNYYYKSSSLALISDFLPVYDNFVPRFENDRCSLWPQYFEKEPIGKLAARLLIYSHLMYTELDYLQNPNRPEKVREITLGEAVPKLIIT